ncbi:hypothetical protein BZG36_02934 [Bifiguratus adelaidae]|uniref:Uncharacterized protein n=1 Tax=Bifiguratus adelaidae TaxID=1938954 RepID=A0A261Y039_9FUNG|nr:hypothetical protein BZG36_02934 [Bifiguratus adelaidae]
MDKTWETIQEKTFTKWVNTKMDIKSVPHIENLDTGISDGVRLIQLLEIIGDTSFGRFNQKPKMRIQKVENVNKALEFIKHRGVGLTNIGAEDIVDSNQKLILGMIWTIILRFTIADINEEGLTAKEGLLLWCQRKTAPYEEVNVKDFTYSWTDGLAFCALIHRHRPDLLDYDKLDKSDRHGNTQLAFDVAQEHLGIPKLLDVEDVCDIAKPDERSVMTYVAEYFHAFSALDKVETAGRRVAKFAEVMASIWEMQHDYERRVLELMEAIDRQTREWQNASFKGTYVDAKNQSNDFNTYKSTQKREWIAEKRDVDTLLGNIQTKLKTYDLAPYYPPEGLTLADLDQWWTALLEAEANRHRSINHNLRDIKELLRKSYADAANDFAEKLNSTSTQLVDLDGELEAQLSKVQTISKSAESLSTDLKKIQDLDNQCNEANVEENDYTIYSVDDLTFDYDLVKQNIVKKKAFIENQMVAREMTNLTPSQLEEFESTFRHFDTDHTNTLGAPEFNAALASLGFAYDDKEFEGLFASITGGQLEASFEQAKAKIKQIAGRKEKQVLKQLNGGPEPEDIKSSKVQHDRESAPKQPSRRNVMSSIFTSNPTIERQKENVVETKNGAASNAPMDVADFGRLGIDADLVSHLQTKLQVSKPTNIQRKAIPLLLGSASGRRDVDVVIQAETGSGKTLTYLLPVVHRLIEAITMDASSTLEKTVIAKRSIGTLAVVLTPTRELAQQVYGVLEALLNLPSSSSGRRRAHWIVPGIVIGGDKKKAEKARLRKGVNVLVCTPGRLLDHLQHTKSFQVSNLKWLILDEADRLLDLGFEETLRDILRIIGEQADKQDRRTKARSSIWPEKRQNVLCSATLRPDVMNLASYTLNSPVFVHGHADRNETDTQNDPENETYSTPKQLKQTYVLTPSKLRLVTLCALLKSCFAKAKPKVIVFVSCRDSVDFHYDLFVKGGKKATSQKEEYASSEDEEVDEPGDNDASNVDEAKTAKATATDVIYETSTVIPKVPIFRLHGELPQQTRSRSFQAFRKHDSGILFCTDVAARGLDLPDVTQIIQYDPPTDLKDYVHRVGRTARLGKEGGATLFLLPSESEYVDILKGQGLLPTQMAVEDVLMGLAEHGKDFQSPAQHLQNTLERHVLNSPGRLELARKAYWSCVRSYATHSAAEKHIFHIKKLHLGHFAKSFALREAPSELQSTKNKAVSKQKGKPMPNKQTAKKRRLEPKDEFAIVHSIVAGPTTKPFYLPGVAPRDYSEGQQVDVWVNALSPLDQQIKSVLEYDYYDPRFHFCTPEGGATKKSESLGSILFGDRIYSSRYEIFMKQDKQCKLLCQTTVPAEDSKFINDRIRENYAVNWIIDGLPAARMRTDEKTNTPFYSMGFELGTPNEPVPHLNNHYEITVNWHQPDPAIEKFRVVGVSVEPYSKKMTNVAAPECEIAAPMVLNEEASNTVLYTYSIKWERSDTVWATRWDNYLHMSDPSIHWFSLVNSVVIVFFLTGMVAMILLRALHKDISRYNADEAQDEDVQEDFGWKLVHGDVFRTPNHSLLLSILVGNGIQLLCMAGVTLVFAVLGFLSPSNRGSLVTVMIIFYMLFGSIAGFVSARVYKMMGGEAWKTNVVGTAFLFPSFIFGLLIILNFFLIGAQSSSAAPFGTMIAVTCLWFLVSAPLSFIGSYLGFQRPRIEYPVRSNQIPRQVPDQVFYLRAIPSMFMGGILPFGAIFIELYFIMNSIWFHRIYYVFGFLFLVFGILIITCAEVTILMCYFHLCSEDYHWWWRAFLTSGASAFYVFLYSVLYYTTKLSIDSFTSTVLYFGYSFIMATMFFVLTGSIGWIACFTGRVKFFNSQKGFGFIIPDDPSERGEVFVHHSAIHNDGGFKSLAEGEEVEYDLVQGPKGMQAANVSGPGGVSVKGDPNAGRRMFGGFGSQGPYGSMPPYGQQPYGQMPYGGYPNPVASFAQSGYGQPFAQDGMGGFVPPTGNQPQNGQPQQYGQQMGFGYPGGSFPPQGQGGH